MGKLSQEKEEILAFIDSILTMLERDKMKMGVFDSLSVDVSPLKFLLSILKRCGISTDEIVDFLSNIIVVITPALEVAIKGLFLTQMVDSVMGCGVDPRIPKKYREAIGAISNSTNFDELNKGLEIDINTIDYYGLLNESPMSEKGQYLYFGTKCYYTIGDDNKKYYSYQLAVDAAIKKGVELSLIHKYSDIDTVYELARANDMNAFLWFVLHKANFINAKNIPEGKEILKPFKCDDGTIRLGDICQQPYHGENYEEFGNVLGLCIKQEYPNSSSSNEIPTPFQGNYSSDQVLKAMITNEQNIRQGSVYVVPATNIYSGLNWYTEKLPITSLNGGMKRNYEKEFALCRLSRKIINGQETKKLVFHIKPAPSQITPSISISVDEKEVEQGKRKKTITYNGDAPWTFYNLLFNADGKQDTKGKYSIVLGNKIESNNEQYTAYNVINPSNNSNATDVTLYVNKKSREYKLEGDNITKVLYECYPGFTIYEFYADLLKSIKIFDATVITAQLVELMTNIRLSINVKRSEYQMRISEIVKKVMNQNEEVNSDCFFTFSNEEYDKMTMESELKRNGLYPFNDSSQKAIKMPNGDDIYGILNEYDSNATLEKNKSVISRTLTQVSATISEEVLPEDKYSAEFNFFTSALENIASIFLESLFTPKVLLIFAINKQIMNIDNNIDISEWSIEKIFDMFIGIITKFITQIRDLILQKLLDWAMEKVLDLLSIAAQLLLKEHFEYYQRILRQMIETCAFKIPRRPMLATVLDNVDYADIDNIEKPQTNEC